MGQGNQVGAPPTNTPGEAQTYLVSFPKFLLRLRCPVEGSLGGASNSTNLRVHFAYNTILILEEGNRPYPRCPKYEMFVSHKASNVCHRVVAFFRKGEERKRLRLADDKAQAGTYMAISAYGIPLSPVTSFKYLGRVISSEEKYCPAVVHNLWRSQQKWLRLYRLLRRKGADACTSGKFYLAVV